MIQSTYRINSLKPHNISMRSNYCYAHFTDEETGRETSGDLAKVTELVSGTAAMQTLESTLSTTRLSSETEIVQVLNT